MRTLTILTSAILGSATLVAAQGRQPSQVPEEMHAVRQALARHHPSLLRGAPLPGNAHAIWFIANDQGVVIAHGLRDSLPSTVGFNAIPAILPELNGRAYRSFTLTVADSTGPASSVSVLWVVLRKG